MSQITKIFEGSPTPSLEKMTGDVGGAVSPDAGFNINLLSDDFLTVTGTPLTNTLTISLDNASITTGQTIGAVTNSIVNFDLGAFAGVRVVEAKVVGLTSALTAGCAFNLICGARTTGAAASLIGVQDKYVAEDAAIVACDANFTVAGNVLSVTVLGAAGLTINWKISVLWTGI